LEVLSPLPGMAHARRGPPMPGGGRKGGVGPCEKWKKGGTLVWFLAGRLRGRRKGVRPAREWGKEAQGEAIGKKNL